MRAVVHDRYGSVDVLRLADVPRPAPADGDVLVEVHDGAELDRARAGIYKFKARAKVGDEVACEAELMCTMRRVS